MGSDVGPAVGRVGYYSRDTHVVNIIFRKSIRVNYFFRKKCITRYRWAGVAPSSWVVMRGYNLAVHLYIIRPTLTG